MVFLSILKIIGIVLLSILGVLLLLIFLVLFVPFRYRLAGSFHDEIPDGRVTVSWLLSILKVRVDCRKEAPLSAKLHLFGFPIIDFLKKDGNKSGKAEKKPKKKVESDQKQIEGSGPDQKLLTGPSEAAAEALLESKAEAVSQTAETQKPNEQKSEEQTSETKSKKRPKGKPLKEKLKDSIDALIEKLKHTYSKVKEAVTDKTDRAGRLYQLWNDERYGKDRTLLIRCVKMILKQILPRGGKGEILFGTGDPFSTGQVMEIAVMLYPLWGKHIELTPEFGESVVDGELNIRGRIHLVVILYAAARVFFNRNLKKMYRKARKILG